MKPSDCLLISALSSTKQSGFSTETKSPRAQKIIDFVRLAGGFAATGRGIREIRHLALSFRFFWMTLSCKLCGYRGSDCASHCPVCGEAYDDSQTRQDGNAAQAVGGLWAQPRSRIGALNGCNSSEGARSMHVANLDLQSLLDRIPEQQERKQRAEEVVRAASRETNRVRADGGHFDPDAVYIQPRADPTMRVLKVGQGRTGRVCTSVSRWVLLCSQVV